MGAGTPLSAIVDTWRALGATRKRLQKRDRLASLLADLEPDELPTAVAWLTGQLPQGRIGLGWATLRSVRSEGAADAATPAAGLTLREVDALFSRLKDVTGSGSGRERVRLLREVWARATPEEQDFLSHLVMGELRQGALAGLVSDAVAAAAKVPAARLRRAVMVAGDLSVVASAALAQGESGLARFDVELMRPLQPMLAHSAKDVEEALARLGRAGLEFKLDGARVQLHKRGDEVRVFTRKLNDVTAAVPELVEAGRALRARDAILDGEAIALRPDGRPRPFQVTMRRFGRKSDDAALREELPLRAFFFDCLYRDGTSLLDHAAQVRFGALREIAAEALLVPRLETDDADEARTFAERAFAEGHEGLMAKSLEAPYEAGARGAGWLKVKRAHTLDLVVLAVEWGSGRRKGLLSNLHLGARDPDGGGFVMLGKTFKGLTDAMLQWQTERFLELERERDEWTVFVRPEQVVEVAFDGIQRSPHYPAGLALRFARVKGYRPDKAAADADTLETVRALYAAQG